VDSPCLGAIDGDGVVGRRCMCVPLTPGKAGMLRISVGMAANTVIHHIDFIGKSGKRLG
jgi:hypothetical protein